MNDDDHVPDEQEDHPSNIEVRDHMRKPPIDECGYCGQGFGPDEIVIEREIYGQLWRFCSDECYRDFRESSDFKDEDLDEDRSDLQVHASEEKEIHDETPPGTDDESQ